MTQSTKEHWDTIYNKKESDEVSWFQEKPLSSLKLVTNLKLNKNASIIDVGGGDSLLVDYLLAEGYTNLTVLDISEKAIHRAKERLGHRAKEVQWIVANILDFKPAKGFDLWHDRAAFHFLTDEQEISSYIETAQKNMNPNGVLVIGTFSKEGPKKCSGIEIKQYSETTMTVRMEIFFEKIMCLTVDHKTPFDTIQNFVFCSFRKLQST
jgi:cyclopropane fatty-acyl-phospholipid synthase-like methyltransferase